MDDNPEMDPTPIPAAKDAGAATGGRETARQWGASTPTNPETLPGVEGAPGPTIIRRGMDQTPEQREIAKSHAVALAVLEHVGIRDPKDLDLMVKVMATSPVERNRIRAAEVLAANRMAAARILGEHGAAPTVDARSVTLNLGDARPETLDAADRLLATLGTGVAGGPSVVVDGRDVRPVAEAHPLPVAPDRHVDSGDGPA